MAAPFTSQGTVTLPPGQIVVPIEGTVHWGPEGEHRGVWGRDLPIAPMLLTRDGTIRNLTRAERRLFEQTHWGTGQ